MRLRFPRNWKVPAAIAGLTTAGAGAATVPYWMGGDDPISAASPIGDTEAVTRRMDLSEILGDLEGLKDAELDLGPMTNDEERQFRALLEDRQSPLGGLSYDITGPQSDNIRRALQQVRGAITDRRGGLSLMERWRYADPRTRALLAAAALGLGGVGAYQGLKGVVDDEGIGQRRDPEPAEGRRPVPSAPMLPALSPNMSMGNLPMNVYM